MRTGSSSKRELQIPSNDSFVTVTLNASKCTDEGIKHRMVLIFENMALNLSPLHA